MPQGGSRRKGPARGFTDYNGGTQRTVSVPKIALTPIPCGHVFPSTLQVLCDAEVDEKKCSHHPLQGWLDAAVVYLQA
jgi:hypothetical protein